MTGHFGDDSARLGVLQMCECAELHTSVPELTWASTLSFLSVVDGHPHFLALILPSGASGDTTQCAATETQRDPAVGAEGEDGAAKGFSDPASP